MLRLASCWRASAAATAATAAQPPSPLPLPPTVSVPWNSEVTQLDASLRQAGLSYLLDRIKLQLVPFNAQDVYQLCGTIYHNDSLGLLADEEVMRGFAAAFQLADQRVLSPFQVTLILDTLRKAGIFSTASEVTVPSEEAVSPESLLHTLRTMHTAKTRDEKKLLRIGEEAVRIIEEYTMTQLCETLTELAKLRFSHPHVVNALLRQILTMADELGPIETSSLIRAVASCPGVSPLMLRQVTQLVDQHLPEFEMEDYQNVLLALLQLGDRHGKLFSNVVASGLDKVEGMDGSTLALFVHGFAAFRFPVRAHVEIYADALVESAADLSEYELVRAFVSLHQLRLLSDDLFASMVAALTRYAQTMSQSHLAPVMDVCSATPLPSDELMQLLLVRVGECLRVLTPNQLAEVLDIIGLYPPARQQTEFVSMAGQQARMRMEIMSPQSLARATRGLAHLGYNDADFYLFAAETGFRFGFPSWHSLEPILLGVSRSPEACTITLVKRLASYAAPLCRSMTLQEVQRANHYFMLLRCEEEFLYRALATRTLQFVKEVTAETPEELRVLLQRAAVSTVASQPYDRRPRQ